MTGLSAVLGNLQSIELINKQTGHRWALQAEPSEQAERPDITPFGKVLEARDGKLQTKEVMATATVSAHLEVVISFSAGTLDVKRTCRIFDQLRLGLPRQAATRKCSNQSQP